jgi:hypothetical protein
MASTIKVTNIDTPDGTGSITIDRPTVLQAGDIVTADLADVNVTTAKIADNAITLAKMAGGVDGNIISYDASGDPVAVVTGSSGQVLTSAGAGAPPTFAAAAAGGAWTIITSTVISDDATIDFTGIDATYDYYVFVGSDVHPATDSQIFQIRVGDSGGVDSGASDYRYHNTKLLDTTSSYASSLSTGDTEVHVGNSIGSAAGEGINFTCHLMRPSDATMRPCFRVDYSLIDAGGQLYFGQSGGQRAAVITMDRIQFFFASGNLATGRITMYGVKHD